MGPERAPAGLVAGYFTDPEGNLIGVAGQRSRREKDYGGALARI